MLIEDIHFSKLKIIFLVRKHIPSRNLGPLNRRAKSRDYEIVRAQEKVSKGCPKTPPMSCSVVTDPQVYCKAICDQAINLMLSVKFYAYKSSHIIK